MEFSISQVVSKVIGGVFVLVFIPMIWVVYSGRIYLLEWTIIRIGRTPIIITFIFDPIGIFFSSTVLFISFNVLIFSTVYIKGDKFIDRFTILVLLFVLSINLLIYIPHFIVLLLGWDGLGITSFILVIYYQNSKSLAAGIVTALTNRIGDVLLLLSIAWTVNQGHWYIIDMWIRDVSAFQILSIIFAAITKSAQIPFSRWLPAAMAAPTPVSALVHSSTLVTAGVFLLIRFYPFLHELKYFNVLLLIIAVSTMLIAGFRAITECDMKKIIALSTLSQLGIIITALGLNVPHLAFFHIITHALFKALLFVCAGGFINSHLHGQDLRWMGNLSSQMPVSVSCITLANLALCGFPFMAGFYSKDMIIESAISSISRFPMVVLSLFRIGLTSFYSLRFRVVTIWGSQSGSTILCIEEEDILVIPIIFLSFMSIMLGNFMSWMSPVSSSMYVLPRLMKIAPFFLIIIGVCCAWLITESLGRSKLINYSYRHFASCIMWYLVPLSSQFIMKFPFYVAHNYLKSVDQGWLEVRGGRGVNSGVMWGRNLYMFLVPNTASSFLVISVTAGIAVLCVSVVFFIYLSSLNKTNHWSWLNGFPSDICVCMVYITH